MSKSILFVINGFGMGNATRCDSLMDVLAVDASIDVITSDKPYLYFSHNPKVTNLFKQKDLIGINNSYEVINYFIKQPASLKLNLILSLFLELSDLVVHNTFCRFVIAPCLDIEVSRNKLISLNKILLSPPLVRWSLMRNLKKMKLCLKTCL